MITIRVCLAINFLLVFSKCSFEKRAEKHLNGIIKEYKYIDSEQWKVNRDFSRIDKFEEFFVLNKKSGDTLNILSFSYFKKWKFRDSSYLFIYGLEKEFVKDSFIYRLALNENDTDYFFKYPLIPKGDLYRYENMIFMVGKYNYMYKNGKLTPSQNKYYKLHEDSLSKIKGNELPPLPDNYSP